MVKYPEDWVTEEIIFDEKFSVYRIPSKFLGFSDEKLHIIISEWLIDMVLIGSESIHFADLRLEYHWTTFKNMDRFSIISNEQDIRHPEGLHKVPGISDNRIENIISEEILIMRLFVKFEKISC